MLMREFQSKCARWCIACFGRTTAHDTEERNWRFLEEALELVQSLGGDAESAHKLVDYVFSRPVGDPKQELGGTMVTLACLAESRGYSMGIWGEYEIDRVSKPDMIEKIRAKHARKPHRSPLPGDYKYAAADIDQHELQLGSDAPVAKHEAP